MRNVVTFVSVIQRRIRKVKHYYKIKILTVKKVRNLRIYLYNRMLDSGLQSNQIYMLQRG